MGSMSLTHWIIVLLIVVLLFGAGKIPRLMGDMAKGVKAFKKGLKDEDDATETAAADVKALKADTPASAADLPKDRAASS